MFASSKAPLSTLPLNVFSAVFSRSSNLSPTKTLSNRWRPCSLVSQARRPMVGDPSPSSASGGALITLAPRRVAASSRLLVLFVTGAIWRTTCLNSSRVHSLADTGSRRLRTPCTCRPRSPRSAYGAASAVLIAQVACVRSVQPSVRPLRLGSRNLAALGVALRAVVVVGGGGLLGGAEVIGRGACGLAELCRLACKDPGKHGPLSVG